MADEPLTNAPRGISPDDALGRWGSMIRGRQMSSHGFD